MKKFLSVFFLIVIQSGRYGLAQGTVGAGSDEAKNLFKQFEKDIEQDFNSFSDSIDREFTKFLNDSWQKFDLAFEPKPDQTPKPTTPPKSPKSETPSNNEIKHTTDISPMPSLIVKDDFTDRLTEDFKLRLSEYSSGDVTKHPFRFQGLLINLYMDSKVDFNFASPPDNHKIAGAWSALSKFDLTLPFDQLAFYATKMKLNDWGLALLTKAAARAVYPDNRIKQTIFTWYALNKMGYRLRLAHDNSGVYLLVPSALNLYDVGYFKVDGIRYYLLNLESNESMPANILAYSTDYNPKGSMIDFLQATSPDFGRLYLKRDFSFPFENRQITLTVVYDSSDVSYYNLFPFVDLRAMFANSPSDTAVKCIAKALQPELRGLSEWRQVNLLLAFLQKGFSYKTDDEQFGKENYLYPEESFFYPYNDCEDRSFLFACLVRDLLGLKVVGLDFPGHVATAVRFNEPVTGTYVDVNSEKYVICDPTYIGADAGMCMPQYQNAELKIINLSSNK